MQNAFGSGKLKCDVIHFRIREFEFVSDHWGLSTHHRTEVLAEEGVLGALMYLAIIIFAIRSKRRPHLTSIGIDRRDAERSCDAHRSVHIRVGSFVEARNTPSSVYVFLYAIILARLEEPIGASTAPTSAPAVAAPSIPRFQNLLR